MSLKNISEKYCMVGEPGKLIFKAIFLMKSEMKKQLVSIIRDKKYNYFKII